MRYENYGPCMCAATDCKSCGPAQGYEVVSVYDARRNQFRWMNPEDAVEAGLYVEDDDEGECDED